MKITLHLTGIRPLVLHNVRLANPLDPWAQQVKALAAKRKKTDEDLIQLLRVEARGGAYETSEGLLGLPTQNLWRSIYDAATAYRRGRDIRRALSFEDIVQPLLSNGAQFTVDEYLTDANHIDYRPVSVNRVKTMRARPIVRDWASSHHFDLLDDVLDARDLAPILERAGRLVGLCEWRPTYGTYAVEVES